LNDFGLVLVKRGKERTGRDKGEKGDRKGRWVYPPVSEWIHATVAIQLHFATA